MKNNLTPSYLSSLIPNSVNDYTPYNLRNCNNIRSIFCRTQLYSQSFLPSVITQWNALPEEIRNSSAGSLKSYLNRNKTIIPTYYYAALTRKSHVLHTRLRSNCSSLNLTLFQKNIVESPLCNCGEIESPDHFLLRCVLYQNTRRELINRINHIGTITTELLLFGNPNLSVEINTQLFIAVQSYIMSSKRFN
jgi:hypothetical protein